MGLDGSGLTHEIIARPMMRNMKRDRTIFRMYAIVCSKFPIINIVLDPPV
jgi:hypothetical protein